MIKTQEEELMLKKYKHKQLLSMFRNVLTRVSNLKQRALHVDTSARFQCAEFCFEITVFTLSGNNTTLTIYDFQEVKKSQKLVDSFLSAIETGDFEKVKAEKTRV